MNISDIIWFFLVIMFLFPIFQQRLIQARRFQMMRALEKKRKSRVITLIHRQETLSFLGLLFTKFIDIEDSEEILRAIRFTPENMPIDLIIHTPGGLVIAAEQIARALSAHKAKVTVFVPHFAMSGGTLLALSADEVVMDPHAILGRLDPQINGMPAISIIGVTHRKTINKIDDNTLIMADISQKAIKQIHSSLEEILPQNHYSDKITKEIISSLASGDKTHDNSLTFDEALKLGLRVSKDMPKEIYELLRFYEQKNFAQQAVQYVPVPYKKRMSR
ncbi:MAG: ATP-dependent Clp protease proteolytic subunit [Candidatus Roizmanbacteria bacterium]|nr:MAG: ATP-dependent Clp protease proteolytic subunit [Candidatus Roizmanbacteria bacterium]